jgi:thiaminase/transcriptional activator TenA
MRSAHSCLLLLCSLALPAEDFTSSLWRDAAPVYSSTLRHPFLLGLSDGKLPRDSFEFYLIQDSLYLRSFAQALHILASKAPREDWAALLARHATEAIEAEKQLHKTLLPSGTPPGELAPTNRAYTNHLLATASRLSFTEGLAAMLPCYWVYWEVGKELKKRGSSDPAYAKWIEQYAAPEYGASVTAVLAIMNQAASAASPSERNNARRLFLLSARYEYLFWDMAWKKERWLPEIKE